MCSFEWVKFWLSQILLTLYSLFSLHFILAFQFHTSYFQLCQHAFHLLLFVPRVFYVCHYCEFWESLVQLEWSCSLDGFPVWQFRGEEIGKYFILLVLWFKDCILWGSHFKWFALYVIIVNVKVQSDTSPHWYWWVAAVWVVEHFEYKMLHSFFFLWVICAHLATLSVLVFWCIEERCWGMCYDVMW